MEQDQKLFRLSCTLIALDKNEAIDHILVHTGQNYDYELNEIFFEDLGLRKPDYFLKVAGKNATETVGNILITIDPILEKENPGCFFSSGRYQFLVCVPFLRRRENSCVSYGRRKSMF